MGINDTSIAITWRERSATSFPWSTKSTRYSNTEEWFSFNHYPLNTKTDDGGPWMLIRQWDRPTFAMVSTGKYDGPCTIQAPGSYSFQTSDPVKATNAELDSKGTTAVARCAPTNPAFSLSTSLAELVRDGVPSGIGSSLIRERAQIARAAGKEYLNVEFGWKPLLSDVRDFARVVKHSHELLEGYRKGSDTKIRRGYDFPTADKTVTWSGGGFAQTPGFFYSGPGTIMERSFTRAWFRGAFRYHIPAGDDIVSKFQRWRSYSDHLLGWQVTPETLWNIAPWSWAADWWGTTGDVLANVSNLGRDGLVMQYGYSMSHKLREQRMTASLSIADIPDPTSSRYKLFEFKQRREATPYGFGITPQALTSKQVAVLGALGLSHT